MSFLSEVTQASLKRPLLVLSVPLVLVATAVAASLLQPTVYAASTKVQLTIGLDRDLPKGAPDDTLPRLQALANQMETEGLPPAVAERVLQKTRKKGLTKSELYRNLLIEQIGNTRYLRFSYRDTDPARARVVVNRVTEAYWWEMADGLGVPGTNAISFGDASWMIDMWPLGATEPKALDPPLVRNGLVALAIGLLLGMGLALLVERRAERSRATLSADFA